MKFTRRRTLAVAIGSLLAFSASSAEMVKVEDTSLLQQGLAAANSIVPSELGFKEKKTVVLPNGKTKVRYQQTYYGVPVFNTSVVATSSDQGPKQVYGLMMQGIKADVPATTGKVKHDQALTIAKQAFEKKTSLSANGLEFQNPSVELMVKLDKNSDAQLVYLVNFFVEADEPSRPYYFIDADSGDILENWEGLAHSEQHGTGPGGNDKTGYYKYGDKYPAFTVDKNDVTGKCTMESANVKTVDMNNRTIGSKAFSYDCPDSSNLCGLPLCQQ